MNTKDGRAMLKEIDPGILDPGIRELVILLRNEGFETVDSGDGFTKFIDRPREDWELPYPHVFILCERGTFFETLDAVKAFLLNRAPHLFRQYTQEEIESVFGKRSPGVEGSASPHDNTCFIEVSNITDDMLSPWVS